MARRDALSLALSFACGTAFAGWFLPLASAQQNRQVEAKELMRTDLGTWCPSKEVIISLSANGPGSSGRNYHPAYSFAWMVEGSQTQYADVLSLAMGVGLTIGRRFVH
jgi:hypothetical protein